MAQIPTWRLLSHWQEQFQQELMECNLCYHNWSDLFNLFRLIRFQNLSKCILLVCQFDLKCKSKACIDKLIIESKLCFLTIFVPTVPIILPSDLHLQTHHLLLFPYLNLDSIRRNLGLKLTKLLNLPLNR